ncbi:MULTISPECIES: hypothetical protein [Alteromonadaceae]|uniref:hypothetical protein n=1 Tax=Alteromonadaceae TaxID=72275 RepID=UPI001C095782|nr:MULTISPECIES: hypothetical protein [Aliiglaciecola]MBU2880030.1 hypothetical protein [Aliiglaciecola lipolytica]MDO6710972.1 hypothetical protein [Aliiglaciecola sp. 2_MG-2023]MDO6752453.1 hypothetical protein [Aliiglaciecola sp. 1_MG-2023]
MNKLLCLFSIIFFVGCSGTDTADTSVSAAAQAKPAVELKKANNSEATQEETEMLTITGTIVYKGMEGGFFGLDANDGKKYMPRGMNKELLQNGMVVEVKGYVLTDVLTFQQYGEVLKVVEAIEIDRSKVKQKDAW